MKRTPPSQLRPSSSSQWFVTLLKRTMRPTSGCAVPWTLAFGAGSPPGMVAPLTVHGPAVAPPSHTMPPESAVVWLPEWKTAA